MKVDPELLITNYVNPKLKIDCEYGIMSNYEWLRKEEKRIKNCRIVRNQLKEEALYRNVI